MNRNEIEKLIEPMIRRCFRELGDFTPKGISDEECASHTRDTLRPDVRRVFLLVSLAQSALADSSGEGLELGFGHIRLYTPAEMNIVMSRLGFSAERALAESNLSGHRGKSEKSWRRRVYRFYERTEAKLAFLRTLGDTWYTAFRKIHPC